MRSARSASRIISSTALTQACERWRRLATGGQPDVLADRQPVEDVWHLRLDADTHAGDLVRELTGDRLAAKRDRARGRDELAGQRLEEGALAGAVRADQAAQLHLLQGEGDVVISDHAAEAHGQMLGLEQRYEFRHVTLLPRWTPSPMADLGVCKLRLDFGAGTSRSRRSRTVGTSPLGSSSTKHDQDGAEDEVGVEGLLRADLRDEILDQDAADDRTEQGAETADGDPDDDLGRQ